MNPQVAKVAREVDVSWDIAVRASALLGVNPHLVEALQVVRYTSPDAEYKLHHDHGGKLFSWWLCRSIWHLLIIVVFQAIMAERASIGLGPCWFSWAMLLMLEVILLFQNLIWRSFPEGVMHWCGPTQLTLKWMLIWCTWESRLQKKELISMPWTFGLGKNLSEVEWMKVNSGPHKL